VLLHVVRDDVQNKLFIRDADGRRRIFIRTYSYPEREMRGVLVLDLNQDGDLKTLSRATRASWPEPGKLRLETVRSLDFGANGKPEVPVRHVPTHTLDTDTSPSTLVAAAEDEEGSVGMQPLSELRRQAAQYPHVPYFRVAYHSRIASIFTPVVLLLIGIPCLVGFEQAVRSRFLGIIVCILVAAGVYLVTFVLGSMGMSNTLNAVLCGWLPTILAGAVGLWLFQSILT
jgi:lipopolysaccharide export LptBFGC system permease protein LptF